MMRSNGARKTALTTTAITAQGRCEICTAGVDEEAKPGNDGHRPKKCLDDRIMMHTEGLKTPKNQGKTLVYTLI